MRGAAAEVMLDALQQMRVDLHPQSASSLCTGAALKALVPLLSDNTPEARASARKAVRILEVRTPVGAGLRARPPRRASHGRAHGAGCCRA